MKVERTVRHTHPHEASAGRAPAWLPLILVAATAAVYANSFRGAFIFDDNAGIIENDSIRQFWPIDEVLSAGRRPIVNLSFALNYAVSELNVRGYHAVNLLVHILAGLTLYGVVRRTLCKPSVAATIRGAGPWLALTIALFWLLHPLQTQSVTYIVQRSESMAGLFYLLSLYGVIRGTESGRPLRWHFLAVASCALGMLTKPIVITAPAVILLYDRVFLGASFSEVFRRRWGLYVGLVATWGLLAVTGVFQQVLSTTPGKYRAVGLAYAGLPWWGYLASQPAVIVRYLRLALWPDGLCLDYAWPPARTVHDIVPYALVVVGLLAVTLKSSRRQPWLGFVGAWFFIILAPTSSFIPIKDLAFEHRMYLPLAAVVACVVLAAWHVLNGLHRFLRTNRRTQVALKALVVTAVAAALGWKTVLRNTDYETRSKMWRDVVTKAPHNMRAYSSLGLALAQEERYDEAMAVYRDGLTVDPTHAATYYNMASTLVELQRYDEAIQVYEKVVELRPDYAPVRYDLGIALHLAGRQEEAAASFREAIRLDPNHAEARFNLAVALTAERKIREALAQYREAVRIRPAFVEAQYNLGTLLLRSGDLVGAVDAFRAAVGEGTDNPELYHMLGRAMAAAGRFDDATAALGEALKLDPDHRGAQQAMAAIAARRGG